SATPVAACLLRWGRDVGFDPVLVESRADRVTPELRASAQVRPSLDGLAIDAETAAVHTDHDAPGVAESVAELLRSPARFVAVMGSRRHVGPHVERLRGLGFGDEELARIRTPAGIDIGARTAEEIALSILLGAESEGKIGRARDASLEAIRGRQTSEMVDLSRAVAREELLPRLYPQVVELMSRHKLAGREVYICSSSPEDYLALLAEMLGV